MQNAQDKNGKRNQRANGRNAELTELVFVLDRSGSMGGLEKAVIDGFNGLVSRQRHLPGKALVSVELFDDAFEVVYDREDLHRVRPLTEKEYFVRGCTALLDAVGRAIRHVARAQREARPEDRPGKTLFVIHTDGLENASREYTRARISRMVKEEKRHGWEFLFLGANIDSYAESQSLGIRAELTCNVVADGAGMGTLWDGVERATASLRTAGAPGCVWREGLDRDYAARGPKGHPRR
jgi:uncharacterized protein YegL